MALAGLPGAKLEGDCTTNIATLVLPNKGVMSLILQSTLTCPACGHAREETMPTDACQYFYECTACGKVLHPLPGDCCVFCSFGTVKCPPIQQSATCCSRPTGM